MDPDAPKSPVNDSYFLSSTYGSSFFTSGNQKQRTSSLLISAIQSVDSERSTTPSKRADRLSARIQHRLRRGSLRSTNSGGSVGEIPLSPSSEPGGLPLRSNSSSSPRFSGQKQKLNRSYEERVNSLQLLTDSSSDDYDTTNHNDRDDQHDDDDLREVGAKSGKTGDTGLFVKSSPSSPTTFDSRRTDRSAPPPPPSAASVDASSLGSGSSDHMDGGKDAADADGHDSSSTHYSTPDDNHNDDDGDDSSTSGSERKSSHVTHQSTRDVSTRTFPPTYYDGANNYTNPKMAASDPSSSTKFENNRKAAVDSTDKVRNSRSSPLSKYQATSSNNNINKRGMRIEIHSEPPPPPPKEKKNNKHHETKAGKAAEKAVPFIGKKKSEVSSSKEVEGNANVTTEGGGKKGNGKVMGLGRSPSSTTPPRKANQASISISPPNQRSNHRRTRMPELMLLGLKSSEESSSSDGGEATTTTTSEPWEDEEKYMSRDSLDEITRTKSKNEFLVGSEQNRRYHPAPSSPASIEEKGTGVTGKVLPPSPLFDRTEVFHQTATAAVLSLLTPRSFNVQDGISVSSGANNQGPPSELHPALSMLSTGQSTMSSAFQAPTDNAANTSPFESLARHDVSSQLITEETEKKLEKLKHNMRDPGKTLADLLTAIHTSDDFESDLGFTVRRKNACGALQVMTAQTENRVQIAWTVGVLPALTSVLRDTGEEGIYISYPDQRHRVEFEAARNRAIACLMNLSMPPKNRIAIFHTPGLVQWLLVICDEGQGIPRKGACAILAFLGKTAENKLLMVQVPGLIDSLEKIVKPPPRRVERNTSPKKLKVFDFEDDDRSGYDSRGRKEEGLTSPNSTFSNESGRSHSPAEVDGYDETADDFLRASRQNVFALLIHLVKEKDNAYHLARHDQLMVSLSVIANHHDSLSHLLAVKILASLTRHRLNTKILVFKQHDVVPALVKATTSGNDSARLYSCYAIQNLAQDKSCRQELAVAEGLIAAICDQCRKAKPEEERLAAISAIKNLCDEPANLIPLTNTPDCIATLMHLAHGMEEGITELMQYRACDALSTLSHWLRKISTSGQALENAKAKKPPPKTLFVPSLEVVSFNQWK